MLYGQKNDLERDAEGVPSPMGWSVGYPLRSHCKAPGSSVELAVEPVAVIFKYRNIGNRLTEEMM